MKLLIVTFGTVLVPSSRTRVFQWLEHFHKRGIQTSIIPFSLSLSLRPMPALDPLRNSGFAPARSLHKLIVDGLRAIDLIFYPFRVLQLLLMASFFDAVYIQKVLLPFPILKLLQSLNPRIGYDFDDALQELSPRKKARLKQVLQLSRLVTLENEFNAHFVEETTKRKPFLILGPIDCSRYFPRPKAVEYADRAVIGWIGSSTTTVYLESIKKALMTVLERNPGSEVHLIGAGGPVLAHPRVLIKPWTLQGECTDLAQFDVGIMPLPDTPWTRGKGGYKLLQYLAMGIPSVTSPVGVNAEIIDHNVNGFHAVSEEDWVTYLDTLIKDRALRTAFGAKARDKAPAKYSFESYADSFTQELMSLGQS